MKYFGLITLFLMLACPIWAQETTSEPTPVPDDGLGAQSGEELPDYLAELKRLAKDHLEAGDEAGLSSAPAARRVRGPISRAEYSSYTSGADFTGQVDADSVSLTRPIIPRVVIRDRDALNYLFDCCAYDEAHPDSIRFIEIYDFSRSGFSNGDMMVAHPSGNSYILDNLDVDFLDSAASWEQSDKLEFRAFHRETAWMGDLVDELSPPEDHDWQDPLPEVPLGDREDFALRAIWGNLHRAVDSQYGEGPLELYFARDDTTTTIEFWGYQPTDLDFQYLGAGDGQGRNDLLTVSVSDTLITAYQTYVDVLMVKDARRDTVYVAPGRP